MDSCVERIAFVRFRGIVRPLVRRAFRREFHICASAALIVSICFVRTLRQYKGLATWMYERPSQLSTVDIGGIDLARIQ
jgi:hypothetical protein